MSDTFHGLRNIVYKGTESAADAANKESRRKRKAERERENIPQIDPCKDLTITSIAKDKLNKFAAVGAVATAATAYAAYSDAEKNLLKDKCGDEPSADNEEAKKKYNACKTELSKDTISYTTNVAQQILRDYGKPIDFGGVIGEKTGWGVRVTSEGISVGYMKTHTEKDASGKDITSRSGIAAGYSAEQETFGMIVENPFGNTMGQFLDGASLSVLGRTGFHHLSDNSFDNLSDNYIDDLNGSGVQSLQAQSTNLNFAGQLAANLKTKLGQFGIGASGQVLGVVAGQAAEYATGATMKNVAAIFKITAETLNAYTEQKKNERDIIETIELTDDEKFQKIEKLRAEKELLEEIASIDDYKRQRELQIEGIRALIHGSLENALEAVSIYAIKKKLADEKKKLDDAMAYTDMLKERQKMEREKDFLEEEYNVCIGDLAMNETLTGKDICNKIQEKINNKTEEIKKARAKEATFKKIEIPVEIKKPSEKPTPTKEELDEIKKKENATLELIRKRKEKNDLENQLENPNLTEEKRNILTTQLSAISIAETTAKGIASKGTDPDVLALLDAENEHSVAVNKLQLLKNRRNSFGSFGFTPEHKVELDLAIQKAEREEKEKKIEQYIKETALRRSKPKEATTLLLEEKQRVLNAKVSEAKEKLEKLDKLGKLGKQDVQHMLNVAGEKISFGFVKSPHAKEEEELKQLEKEVESNKMTIKLNAASKSEVLEFLASSDVKDKLKLADENKSRKDAQAVLGHMLTVATFPLSMSVTIGAEIATQLGNELLSGHHVDENASETHTQLYSMLGYDPNSRPEQIAELAVSIASQARVVKNIETLEEIAEEVNTDFKSGIPMLVEGHSYLKFLNENWSKWRYFLPRYYPPPVLEDIPIVVTDILNAMPSQIYAQKTISEKSVDSASTIVENITSPEKMISRALQGVFGADIYDNLVKWLQKKYLYQQYSTAMTKEILNGKNSSSNYERAWVCKEEELKELINLNEDINKNKYIKNYALHSIKDSEIETYFSLIEKEVKDNLFNSELYSYYNGTKISNIYDSSKTEKIKIHYKCALQLEKLHTEITTLNRDEIRHERSKSIRQLITNYNPFTIEIIREKKEILDIYFSQMDKGEQRELTQLINSPYLEKILKIYQMDDEDKTFILESLLEEEDIKIANSLDTETRRKVLELDEAAIELYYDLSSENIQKVKEYKQGAITESLQSLIFKSLGVDKERFFEILDERGLEEEEVYEQTINSIKKIITVYEETTIPILTRIYADFLNNPTLKELPMKLVRIITKYKQLISILASMLNTREEELDTPRNIITIKTEYTIILEILRKYFEDYISIFNKLGIEHTVKDEINFIQTIKTLYNARNKREVLTDEEKLLLDLEINYNLSQLTLTKLPLLIVKKQSEKKTAINKLRKNHPAKYTLEKEEIRNTLNQLKKEIKKYTNYFISKKEQAETFESIRNRNSRMLNESRVNSMMILYDQLVELNNSQSYFGVEDPKFADEFETKIVNLCKYLKDSTISINGENKSYNEYKDEFDAFRYYHENKNARLRAFVNKYQIGDNYIDDEKEYSENQIKIEEFKLSLYRLEQDVLCYYTRHIDEECEGLKEQDTVYSMKTVLLTLYAYLHNNLIPPTKMRNFKDTCRTKTLDINIQLSTGVDLSKLAKSVLPESLAGHTPTKEEEAATQLAEDRKAAEERIKHEGMTEKQMTNYINDKNEEAYQKSKKNKERRNRIAKGTETEEDKEYMKQQIQGEKKIDVIAKINPSISYKTSMAIYPPAGTLIHQEPTLSEKQKNEKRKRVEKIKLIETRDAIHELNKLAEPEDNTVEDEREETPQVVQEQQGPEEPVSLEKISKAKKLIEKVSTCAIPEGVNTSAPLNLQEYPSRYFDKKAAYLEHVKESSFKNGGYSDKGRIIDGLMGILTHCENINTDKDWCEPPKKIINNNKLVDNMNSEKFSADNLITEVKTEAETPPEEINEIIPDFKINKKLYDKLQEKYTEVKNDPIQLAIQQEIYTWFMWRYSQLWRIPTEDTKYANRKIIYTQDDTVKSTDINTLRNEYTTLLNEYNYLEYMVKDTYTKKIQATKNLWKLMYALRMTSYQNIINRSNRGNQEIRQINEQLKDIDESINYLTLIVPKEVKTKTLYEKSTDIGSSVISTTFGFIKSTGLFIILGLAAALAISTLGPTLALSATTVSIYNVTISVVTASVVGVKKYQEEKDKQFEVVRTLMIKEIEQDSSVTVTKLNKLLQLQRSINILVDSPINDTYKVKIQNAIVKVNNLETSAFEHDTINNNLNTKKDTLETILVDKDIYLKQTINNFQNHILLLFKQEEQMEIRNEIAKILSGPEVPPIKEGDKVKLKVKNGEVKSVKGSGFLGFGQTSIPLTREDYQKEYGFLANDLIITDDNKQVIFFTVGTVLNIKRGDHTETKECEDGKCTTYIDKETYYDWYTVNLIDEENPANNTSRKYAEYEIEQEITHEMFEDKKRNCANSIATIQERVNSKLKAPTTEKERSEQAEFQNKYTAYTTTIEREYNSAVDKMEEFKHIHKDVSKQTALTETAKNNLEKYIITEDIPLKDNTLYRNGSIIGGLERLLTVLSTHKGELQARQAALENELQANKVTIENRLIEDLNKADEFSKKATDKLHYKIKYNKEKVEEKKESEIGDFLEYLDTSVYEEKDASEEVVNGNAKLGCLLIAEECAKSELEATAIASNIIELTNSKKESIIRAEVALRQAENNLQTEATKILSCAIKLNNMSISSVFMWVVTNISNIKSMPMPSSLQKLLDNTYATELFKKGSGIFQEFKRNKNVIEGSVQTLGCYAEDVKKTNPFLYKNLSNVSEFAKKKMEILSGVTGKNGIYTQFRESMVFKAGSAAQAATSVLLQADSLVDKITYTKGESRNDKLIKARNEYRDVMVSIKNEQELLDLVRKLALDKRRKEIEVEKVNSRSVFNSFSTIEIVNTMTGHSLEIIPFEIGEEEFVLNNVFDELMNSTTYPLYLKALGRYSVLLKKDDTEKDIANIKLEQEDIPFELIFLANNLNGPATIANYERLYLDRLKEFIHKKHKENIRGCNTLDDLDVLEQKKDYIDREILSKEREIVQKMKENNFGENNQYDSRKLIKKVLVKLKNDMINAEKQYNKVLSQFSSNKEKLELSIFLLKKIDNDYFTSIDSDIIIKPLREEMISAVQGFASGVFNVITDGMSKAVEAVQMSIK